MKRLLKRLSLQWRITLLTILLLAAACVTMKTLLCSSGHAYMDSIGNYVMHYVQEDPQAVASTFLTSSGRICRSALMESSCWS